MYSRGIKIRNAPLEMISKPMSSSLTMLDSIIEASEDVTSSLNDPIAMPLLVPGLGIG